MATPAQIAANRRNALESTGPRTPAGKAASSRNALKHGLHSRILLAAEPVREQIQQIEANFAAEYPPTTPERTSLLRRLAEALWRHDYAMQVEKDTWKNLLADNPQNEPNPSIRMGAAFQKGHRLFAKINAYMNRAMREYYRLMDALQALCKANPQNEPNFNAAAMNEAAVSSIYDSPVSAIQRCAVST
jgi:hypothetical protein